jgi:hypothetical protein
MDQQKPSVKALEGSDLVWASVLVSVWDQAWGLVWEQASVSGLVWAQARDRHRAAQERRTTPRPPHNPIREREAA